MVKAFHLGCRLSIAAALMAGAARADYTVVTAHETQDVRVYSVSGDGSTWTYQRVFKARTADGGNTPISVATDGAYIYIGDKKEPNTGDCSWVHRYRLDGTYVGVFLDLSTVCRLDSIAIDPRHEWLYVSAAFGGNTGKQNKIYRYRLSNPAEGGEYITSGLSTPREIVFAPDGLLYASNRGSGQVYAYDVSGTTPGLKYTYVASNNGGVAVDERYVHVPSGTTVRRFDINTGTSTNFTVSGLNNAFCSFYMGGTAYIGSYNGKVVRCLTNGTYQAVASLGTQLCGLCCVPMPVAHWRFNEPANATVYTNVISAADYPIRPYGDLRSGATGVEGGGLWFSDTANSRGFIKDSIGIIGQTATNDFSIFFWGGVRTSGFTGEHIFVANNWSQPNRCAIAANLGGNTGRISFFHPAGNSTHLTSTSRVDDAQWHHVGVVRRSGTAELWLDGRLESTGADAGALTQTGEWTVGSLGGAYNRLRDGVMDDLRFYRFALATNDILSIYSSTAPADTSLPTEGPADPPEPDLAAAAAFGTIVRSNNILKNPLGVQTLVVASDGTYWAACGHTVLGVFEDSPTYIHKSTDHGATWTCVGTNTALARASLVLDGDKIGLVGTKNVWNSGGQARFASSSDGVAWTTYDLSPTINAAYGRVLSHGGRYWVATTGPGVFSFSWADGSPSAASLVRLSDVISSTAGLYQRSPFTAGYEAPVLFARDDAVQAIVPTRMKRSAYTAGPGYAFSFEVAQAAATMNGTFTMPGASKDFDMVYDPVSARYWAVLMPERRVASSALPSSVNHVLALYSSADGATWTHHQDIVTATYGVVGFISPSIAIDGDDLAILFGAAVPDGSVELPNTEEANYTLFRKVANFRSLAAAEIDTHRFLLVADTYANGVSRYYPTTNGDWIFGGVLVPKGTYGGLPLDKPHGLAWGPDSLYVNNMDGTNVFEFARDGTFKRMVADFWTSDYSQAIDNIALSCDHRYLYCSDMVKRHCIWRIDLATLEKTEWVTADSQIVTGVRGLVAMRDGSLVVADRTQNRVIRLAADGSLAEVLVDSTAGLRKPQAICYDERNNLFYVDSSDTSSTYSFPNQAGASLTRVAPFHSFSLTMLNGKPYNSIWEDGAVVETVPDSLTTSDGKNAKNAILLTGISCGKILGVELKQATLVIIR